MGSGFHPRSGLEEDGDDPLSCDCCSLLILAIRQSRTGSGDTRCVFLFLPRSASQADRLAANIPDSHPLHQPPRDPPSDNSSTSTIPTCRDTSPTIPTSHRVTAQAILRVTMDDSAAFTPSWSPSSLWPLQRILPADIPNVLEWGVLAHYLLPWVPAINLGQKADGPPRWTKWLESWYDAYNPTVWKILQADDEDDQRLKHQLSGNGKRLLKEGAADDVVQGYERQHYFVLARRLRRRVRLYRVSCSPSPASLLQLTLSLFWQSSTSFGRVSSNTTNSSTRRFRSPTSSSSQRTDPTSFCVNIRQLRVRYSSHIPSSST
jgi:hypothetical protein